MVVDLQGASAPHGLVSQSMVDSPGLAKPPEKRKAGGSIPPLTTTLTCADVLLVIVTV
jgi:hypothetical protein